MSLKTKNRRKNFKCKCRQSNCSEFPTSAKYFIIIELLVSISVSFCQFLINDVTVLKNNDLIIETTLYFHKITEVGAYFVGILFGYLADSYFGKHSIVLMGVIFATIAPMCSLLLKFKIFYTKLKQFALYAARYGTAFCLATTGVRTALYMNQLRPETFSILQLKNYIFMYWFVRTFAYAFSALSFFYSTVNPNIIFWYNIIICLTVPAVTLITYFVKFKMENEQIIQGCIEKCFICACRTLSCSIFAKNERAKWDRLFNKVDVKTFFLTRRFTNLCRISIPIFSVGLNTYVIEEWIKEQSQVYDLQKKHRIVWLATCALLVLELIILLILHCIIMLFFAKSASYILELKYVCISMFILFLAGLSVCAVTDGFKRGYFPIHSYAQIRIYNGLAYTVTLESKWFISQQIPESEGLIVDNVPCLKVCSSAVTVYAEHHTNMELTMEAIEAKSLTYVLSEQRLRKLHLQDPILSSSELKDRPVNKALVIVFTNMLNFSGIITIQEESYETILDNDKNDAIILEVSIGEAAIHGFSRNELMETNLIFKNDIMNFLSRGVYSFFIYESDDSEITLTIDAIALPIDPSLTPYTFLILLGPSILLCLAKVLMQINLLYVFYLECPHNISSVVYSCTFFALSYGPIVWIVRGSVLEIGMELLVVLTTVQWSFFLLCILFLSKYISNFRDVMTTEEYNYFVNVRKMRAQ